MLAFLVPRMRPGFMVEDHKRTALSEKTVLYVLEYIL